MDFGVVANVDGERRVKIKSLNRSGVRVRESKGAKLEGESAGFPRSAHRGFDHHGRQLIRSSAEANEGAPCSPKMGAENLFTGLWIKNTLGCDNAFSLTTAKLKTALGIEQAAIAKPVIGTGG